MGATGCTSSSSTMSARRVVADSFDWPQPFEGGGSATEWGDPWVADLRPPRRQRLRLRPEHPYPDPPPWFVNSLAEWVVYYWLTTGRRSRGLPGLREVGPTTPPVRGETFFYQVQVGNLGQFQSEATRIDFLLPGFGGAGYEALAIDPANSFTHNDPILDLFKRASLADQENIQLVWIDTERLEAGDFDVIEAALRGEDQSSLARTGMP